MFPFFQSLGISPDCHDFKYRGDCLGNSISQFPQDSVMNLVRSHRLLYVQVPQMVMNLIFFYSGKRFGPLVPILQSIHSRGVGRELAKD